MSLRKSFALNKNAEQDGVELKLYEAENEDGTIPTIIVARAGGSNEQFMAAATKPAMRNHSNVSKQRSRMIDLYARTVVKSWTDVYDENEDGEVVKLKYSVENCIKLLTKYPLLYERVVEYSNESTNFLMSQLDEIAKN